MKQLNNLIKFIIYLLFACLVGWFALVSWLYLTPANWLANHAQTGFIYQRLSSQTQEFIRQTSWQELNGSLGKGKATRVLLPLAQLENISWQTSFFSLLIAQPQFKLKVDSTQIISPLNLNLGTANASLKPHNWQSLLRLSQPKNHPLAKFNWQLKFFLPEEHQLNLTGDLTPKEYHFNGLAELNTKAKLLPAMQLLNWRKIKTPAESLTKGQSFQGRGSGSF